MCALALLFAACATAPPTPERPRALKRKDWVLTWDREVERQSTFGGQAVTIIGPAEGAIRQVRLRADLDAEIAEGKRPFAMGLLGGMSPPVFDPAERITVRCGEVVERTIEGEPFRLIEHAPSAARVYWTIGHFRTSSKGREPFSSLFLEGVETGADRLVVLPNAADRELEVDVVVSCGSDPK